MTRLLQLIKVMFINSGIGQYVQGSHNDEKARSKAKQAFIIIGSILLVILAGLAIFFMAYTILNIAKDKTTKEVDMIFIRNILSIYIPAFIVLVIIFTNSIVIQIFYLSNDNNVYLPLPIKPYELFIARFITALFGAYLIQIIILTPCYLAYNYVVHPNFLIVINQVLLFFSFPFVPLAFILLYTTLVSKIVDIKKNKTAFSIISFLIAITLMVVMQLFSSFSFPGKMNYQWQIDDYKDLIAKAANSFRYISFIAYLPEASFFEKGIMSTVCALLFFFASISFLFFTIVLTSHSYGKTLVQGNDSTIGKKDKLESLDKAIKKECRPRSLFGTYVQKEWRSIARSPSAFFQLILPPIIVISLVAISIFGVIYASKPVAEDLAEVKEKMDTIININKGFITYFTSSFAAIVCSMTLITASSVSREGPNAYLVKNMPIKPKVQIHAKMFLGIVIDNIIILLVFFGTGLGIRVTWYLLALYCLPAFLVTFITNYLMIFIDLANPYLDWVNELDSIKQNKNSLYSILMTFAFAIALGGVGCIDLFFIKANLYVTTISLIIILLLGILLCELRIHRLKHTIFNRIK